MPAPADNDARCGDAAARTPPSLLDAQDQFVQVWGRMASAWGISRTMAEVHALLYIAGEPLCADDVMDRLEISRGNASMSLRALLDWGVIHRAHKRGDRKDYFAAEQDVWTLFRAIVRGRLKREVEPLVASLLEMRDLARRDHEHAGKKAQAPDPAFAEHDARLNELLEFFVLLSGLAQRFAGPEGEGLKAAATLLGEASDGGEAVGAREMGR